MREDEPKGEGERQQDREQCGEEVMQRAFRVSSTMIKLDLIESL